MKTLTHNQLKSNLIRKGIILETKDYKTFSQHDYFQIINAYKYLFVDSYEDIDTIINNINSGDISKTNDYINYYKVKNKTTPTSIINDVLNFIREKYGLQKSSNYTQKVEGVRKIGYVKHIYATNTNYSDFVRMYYLELELRNLLMKYTLYIEEKIKKVFITVLNNKNADANYLADISNYNLAGNNKNGSIHSLGMIIKMHSNGNSKPIKHKMDQELTVPYWILINEMTLGQTLQTISNIDQDTSKEILVELINEMTRHRIDLSIRLSRNAQMRQDKLIRSFYTILSHLGDFRNHLAHNQPIYCYNVLNNSAVTYLKPKVKPDPAGILTLEDQQHNINQQTNTRLALLFGSDAFNSRHLDVNIDLSWIIYVIKRITDVVMPNNNMKKEIQSIYKKHNVILSYSPNEIEDCGLATAELLKLADYNVDDVKKEFEEINNCISNGWPYKQRLNNLKKQIINHINIAKDAIEKETKVSLYPPFTAINKYYQFTNIDSDFLIKYL